MFQSNGGKPLSCQVSQTYKRLVSFQASEFKNSRKIQKVFKLLIYLHVGLYLSVPTALFSSIGSSTEKIELVEEDFFEQLFILIPESESW